MPMAIAWRTASLSNGANLLFIPKYMTFRPTRSLSWRSGFALTASKSVPPTLSMPSTVPAWSSTSRWAASVLQRMMSFSVLAFSPQ
jgi:hypothetical protein